MTKRFYLSAFLISAIMHFGACDPLTIEEENYDLYEGLTPVEGAENTMVTIQQGSAVGRDAYFQFTLDNVGENELIDPGVYDGWCIEWTKPIAQQGDTHDGLQMYSTYGKEKWKPLNYFLNLKNQLQTEDPNLTFKEFQAVIWSVVEGPDFDLATMPDNKIPPRLMKDGEPDFSKEKVQSIVKMVRTNAPDFIYSSDVSFALFLKTGDDEQDIMVPVEPVETVSHGYVAGVTPENINPENAWRTYPVINADWAGPGGDKRWLGWNLGATKEADGLTDDSPESAGWYFQFNRVAGIFPGVPNGESVPNFQAGNNTGPQDPSIDSDWIDEDPCAALLEGTWRIPTLEEWQAVVEAEVSTRLNLHYSGYILGSLSFLTEMGTQGRFWSSTQHNSANNGYSVLLDDEGVIADNISLMYDAMPLRCVED